MYPLDDEEGLGITYLEPGQLLSSYQLDEKRIVVEATTKQAPVPPNAPAAPVAKRSRPSEIGDMPEAVKRPKLVGGPVHLTKAASGAIQIALPAPSSGFQDWLNVPRTAIVDKTNYISPLYGFLGINRCAVWQPSGSGKSGLLSTVFAYWDVLGPPETRDTFLELKIGDSLRTTPSATYGRGEYLCLALDFQLSDLETAIETDALQTAFDTYLASALRSFLMRYHKEFGFNNAQEVSDMVASKPPLTVRGVFHFAKILKKKIFVGIDNFDAALSTALTVLHWETREPCYLKSVTTVLNTVLDTFLASKIADVKLLALGRLPVCTDKLQQIGNGPSFRGAFGMSQEEMRCLFRVISGEGMEIDLAAMPGLEEKPVPVNLPLRARQESHSFTLFFHYMANSFRPTSLHRNPPGRSPLLQSMKKNQQELFPYLQRSQSKVSMTAIERNPPDLSTFSTDHKVAWWALYHEGDLEFVGLRSNGHWLMAVPINPIVRAQLFGDPPLLKSVKHSEKDTPLEAELRGLLEGRPDLLTSTISNLLFHTPISQLSNASETVLQTVFDTHIKREKLHQYSSQLELLTNKNIPEKSQTQKEEEFRPKRSRGKKSKAAKKAAAAAKPAPGEDRYGAADCVICGLDELGVRVLVLIELKYINLEGLLDAKIAQGETEPQTRAEQTKRLKALNRKIRTLSPEQLKKQPYRRWDTDTEEYIDTTVGDLITAATSQRASYLRAIKSGQGNTQKPQNNGVLDPRVTVVDGSDVILPLVIVGIGSRLIVEQGEKEQTSFRYFGNPTYKPDI
ncbi:hypothetical protein DFH06DRAFT_1467455 [Mycena polygramma]|nr:hypothetical protein DFH06DRAFT_1467455 [Mycena polygramma]